MLPADGPMSAAVTPRGRNEGAKPFIAARCGRVSQIRSPVCPPKDRQQHDSVMRARRCDPDKRDIVAPGLSFGRPQHSWPGPADPRISMLG